MKRGASAYKTQEKCTNHVDSFCVGSVCCPFVPYPLPLIVYKHPTGPQMAVRMVLKMSAKDKQYKGVHRLAEQDLQRSELLLFILMACYCLSHAAMYSLVKLTISLLGKTCKEKLV